MGIESALKDFLKDSVVLIVEPSQVFSASIQNCLGGLGLRPNQMISVRRYADAMKVVQEKRPRIIFTEYEVDNQSCLALAEHQEKFYDDNERLAMVCSKNASASAIAEAAEGQIDSYLLKPFTIDGFKQKLTDLINWKLNPSAYALKLSVGKMYFNAKEFGRALPEFLEAKPLNEKPSLACYYAGQCHQALGDNLKALDEYQEGRRYQPLHYKCLMGEFEGLMAGKRYLEAYPLIDPIMENYPLTAKRLGQMYVACIFSHRFERMPTFYNLYSSLDHRTPDLVNIASLANFTAGKHYLRSKDREQAAACFEMATSISNRSFELLERIITELIQDRAANEAAQFLTKVNFADTMKVNFKRLAFKVEEMTLTKEQLVEKGRQLVMAGLGSPEVFEMVVRATAQAGKETLAESMIIKALETHPDLRTHLYQILENHLPKKAGNL